MPPDATYYAINKADVEDALATAPTIFNQEINRATRTIATDFGRRFSKTRLGRGGINILRRGRPGAGTQAAPGLPSAMRGAGFRAKMSGLAALEGKTLQVGTRNPAMLAHELLLTIRAKTPKGLAISFSKGPGAANKKLPWKQRQAAAQQGNDFFLRRGRTTLLVRADPVTGTIQALAHIRQSVTMRRALGFLDSWDSYLPEAVARIDKAILKGMKRIHKPAGPSMGAFGVSGGAGSPAVLRAGAYGWIRPVAFEGGE